MAQIYVERHCECADCGRIKVSHFWMKIDDFDELADREPDNVIADYSETGKNVIFKTDLCLDCETKDSN